MPQRMILCCSGFLFMSGQLPYFSDSILATRKQNNKQLGLCSLVVTLKVMWLKGDFVEGSLLPCPVPWAAGTVVWHYEWF